MVFTEQSVAMLSSVLKSDTAIEVNIQIIRIFTRIREVLPVHKNVVRKIEHIEKRLMKTDHRVNKHEEEIQAIFSVLKQLPEPVKTARKMIGYKSQQP